MLGKSQTVSVPQAATWIATGNNLVLKRSMQRRCYWIRLDAKTSQPWRRTGFKYEDVLAETRKRRGELIAAFLTLVRGWVAADRPKADVPPIGGFNEWARLVGGILAFAGVKGFLGNMTELYETADDETIEWEVFLRRWYERYSDRPTSTAEVEKDLGLFRDVLPGDLEVDGSFTRRLGKALAKRNGTRYGADGIHIERAGDEKRAVLWRVVVPQAKG
jgi:hypothetical protein